MLLPIKSIDSRWWDISLTIRSGSNENNFAGFLSVKFRVIFIGPAFNIIYFRLTTGLTRSRGDKVGIVGILSNNIGRAERSEVRGSNEV